MGERNTEKMLLVGSSKDIFQQVRKEQKDFGKEKKKVIHFSGSMKVWLGRRKKMANTDWREAARKQHRVGNVDGQAPHPAAGMASSAGKWNTKAWWHWTGEAGGFGDQAPFTAAILMLGCEGACCPQTSRQPQHHSAPSQLRLDLKVPTRSRGNSRTPPISPPWPRCCGMLGRRVFWRWLYCFKNSTNLAKKKKHCRDCSVAKLCPASCDPMGCSTPGFPVLHYLLGFAQTHIHWVSDTIQLSNYLILRHPLVLLPSISPSIRVFSKESCTSPYFRDKKLKLRWIFKATLLECGEARGQSAASVLITWTFPQFDTWS